MRERRLCYERAFLALCYLVYVRQILYPVIGSFSDPF